MSYQVTLKPSGHTFQVESSESLLEAALRNGIALAYSCISGSCGECKAKLLEGKTEQIQFHDYVLSEAEKLQQSLLLCSHTAKSDCIIEAWEAQSALDIPQQRLKAKVAKIETVGDDYRVLHLRTPRTQTLRFLAGQQVQLKFNDEIQQILSIASCPCNGMMLQFHIHQKPDNKFSQFVFDKVKTGDSVEVTGPQGEFSLDEESRRPIVMVAIDTGFSAMKSLIEHAIALDIEQSVHLFWIVTGEHQHYLENYCRSWEYALDTFVYIPMELKFVDDETLHSDVIDELLSRGPIESEIDLYISGIHSLGVSIAEKYLAKGTPATRIFLNT